MSASAFPYGMVPVENYGAGYNSQGFETRTILDGYATSIYFGDVVKIAADGTMQKDTGTSTLTPYGIFLGCRYIQPGTGYVLDSQYWPASTTTGGTVYAKVSTFLRGVFQIQADGSVPMSALGDNASIVQTAGTASFGKSRNALSAASVAGTSSLPLRIVDVLDTPSNAWGDAFTDVLVIFNQNQQQLNSTGI